MKMITLRIDILNNLNANILTDKKLMSIIIIRLHIDSMIMNERVKHSAAIAYEHSTDTFVTVDVGRYDGELFVD